MPHGLGKICRVLVFTDESNHELAKKAGADIIGN
jgi:ribosomal protein L1